MTPTDSFRTALLEGESPPAQDLAGAEATPDLRALFEAHHAAVWRLLRRLGVQPAQVDDAAQEVFWIAARRIDDIRPGRAQSFLYGVALRVAAHMARKQRAASRLVDEEALDLVADAGPNPEEQLDRQRLRALLDLVLDQMSQELRSVLVLFELEGMQVREIAELHDLPLGTASSRLRRAREEFAEISRRVIAKMSRGGR